MQFKQDIVINNTINLPYTNSKNNKTVSVKMAECTCKCGKNFTTRLSVVSSGKISSCGCERKGPRKDYIYTSNGVEKLCFSCKVKKPLNKYTKNSSKVDKLHHICKECTNGKVRENYKKINPVERSLKNKKLLNKHKDSPKARYRYLKLSAKLRDLEMNITMEQHQTLLKDKICFYCDENLKNQHGCCLNRIDSTKGYILENVKPCCTICNKIMLDFTKEQLISRLLKIAERL